MIALFVTTRQSGVVTCARPSQRDSQINARTAVGARLWPGVDLQLWLVVLGLAGGILVVGVVIWVG